MVFPDKYVPSTVYLFAALLFVFLGCGTVISLYADIINEEVILDEEHWIADFNDYYEIFPIPINTASYEDLALLTQLSDRDIEAIMNLRSQRAIESKEDLRNMGISDDIIAQISSYITFLLSESPSIRQRWRYFGNELSSGETAAYYQATELTYHNIRAGFVSRSNDLSSIAAQDNTYYFYYQSDTVLKQLTLGRYRLSLGQGIAYAPAFGFGKSAAVITQPVKNFSAIRPHTNPYQMWSMEGAAAVIKAGYFELIPFYSDTNLHARIEDGKIRTIYAYGEHRQEQKKQLRETIGGMALQYSNNHNRYGGYYSYNSFNREFFDSDKSAEYKAMGLYFRQNFRRLLLFGEYAGIDAKKGLIAGIRWGELPFRQLLLFRYYEDNLHVWRGNPFSAGSTFDNETGIYYGLELRPARNFTVSTFLDIWQYPETSYFEKMPVTGSEQFIQLHYKLPDNSFRLRFKNKVYDKYRVINDRGLIRKEKQTVTSFLWQHSYSSTIELRTGIEYIDRYIQEIQDYKRGILLYENVRWQSGKYFLMGQINVYNSEISHYPYEYSLQGMWENRPLTGDDIYVWLLGGWKLTERITVQSKAARFYSSKPANFYFQITYEL